MNKEYRYVGKSLPARDGAEKVSGRAVFTADQVFPKMLYAKFCGSAHPHALIKSVDTAEAAAVPGVKAIITCFDAPEVSFEQVETKPLTALSVHAMCLGDEIAAVAATSLEAAEEAVKRLEVEYEILPVVFDAKEALKDDAPRLYDYGNQSLPDGPLKEEWGDVDRAFAQAAAVAEGTFKTQMHLPTPIEPRSCVASWNGKVMELWSSTQFPHRVRADVATVLGLPLNRVRVVNSNVGGGFGGKKQDRVPVIAALLSQKVNRPVKFEYTREDEHSIARRRYAANQDVALACDTNGRLTGIKFEGVYDVGAYGNPIGGSLFFLLSQFFVYKFGSGRFTAWDVNTNSMTAQPFRGVQAPAFHFAVEQLMDALARQVDLDPIEFRLRNTYRSHDETAPFGEVISTYPIEECLEKGKKAFGWHEKWGGWSARKPEGVKRRGVGMATSLGWCDWERTETGVVLEVQKDGSAMLFTGTSDIGTDSKTTLTQIVAEELNLSIDRVGIITGDTAVTPHDHGCCASRTLFLAGLAIRQAAENVRDQILELAAEKMADNVLDLYLEDGAVKSRVSDAHTSLTEVLHNSVYGLGALPANEEAAFLRSKHYVGGAAAHFAEVEVDTATGEVELVQLVAVHDVGRAINPAIVENQIYGAAIQGIGYALTEELRFDPAKNRYLEDTYTDYKIPTIGDIGGLQAIIVEPDEPLGPYGAKGIGEHALNCTAGAIANAVRDAVGHWMPELPMTPERVLQRLA